MIEKFTRTFHPVGHGAFYTETIVANQRIYNIVYDCGLDTKRYSSDFKKKDLKKYIDNLYCEDDIIDLLFISHFHDDHINGIEFLKDRCKKIEKVVMPLLDNEKKASAHLSLALEGGDTTIIDDPQSYFGQETRIIYVNPISDDNNEKPNNYYLNDFRPNATTINSGDKIVVDTDWYYIPYNYKQEARFEEFCKKLADIIEDDENLKEFNEALKNSYLTIDIDLVSKIIENTTSKNKLIEAYKEAGKIGGGIKEQPLNLTSLILYSGDEQTKLVTCNKKFCYERRFWRSHSGCLYLGDTNLNQNNIVSDIKKRLSSLWKTVSMIQIPHHGAEPNYNPAIISSYLKFAVVSCKEGDRLHPSNNVINDFNYSTGRHLFKVTEEKESIVMQFKR